MLRRFAESLSDVHLEYVFAPSVNPNAKMKLLPGGQEWCRRNSHQNQPTRISGTAKSQSRRRATLCCVNSFHGFATRFDYQRLAGRARHCCFAVLEGNEFTRLENDGKGGTGCEATSQKIMSRKRSMRESKSMLDDISQVDVLFLLDVGISNDDRLHDCVLESSAYAG